MHSSSKQTLLSNEPEEFLVLRVTETEKEQHIRARKVMRRLLFHSLLCFALVLIKQRQNMIVYQRKDALFKRATFSGSHFCLYNLVNCLYKCVLVCTSAFILEF